MMQPSSKHKELEDSFMKLCTESLKKAKFEMEHQQWKYLLRRNGAPIPCMASSICFFSVGEPTRAHLKGYQELIRIHSQMHNKVNSSHSLPFCSGVNGTSGLISDHHEMEGSGGEEERGSGRDTQTTPLFFKKRGHVCRQEALPLLGQAAQGPGQSKEPLQSLLLSK